MDVTSRKDRMFQRLAGLVKDRFNTIMTFTDFAARMRVADAKTTSIVQRSPAARFIVTGNDVVMPIRSANSLFGYITLFDAVKLEDFQIDQIRDVTDLLLTETCALEDKSQKLKILEHHLKTFHSFDQVIDLRSRMNDEDIRFLQPEIQIAHHELENLFPVLIEAHSIAEGQEFAIEIHRVSGRSSFVTYEPYLAAELSSVEQIKSMGPITLYFANIREVPLDIQMCLESFLRTATRTTLHPRIIVGMQENPDSLISIGVFSKGLFERLSNARVKLPPKGTSSMSVDEILGFFEATETQQQKRERHLYLVTPAEPPH